MREAITNNRITYAMDILERQSEIRMYDKNSDQLIATSVKQSNDRNDSKTAKKGIIDVDIRGCAK